jgi:hypothetical protein
MEIYGRARKDQLESGRKELKDYTCPWCGYKFQQYVGTAGGIGDAKHSSVSTQVKCKVCNNFMKTWGD